MDKERLSSRVLVCFYYRSDKIDLEETVICFPPTTHEKLEFGGEQGGWFIFGQYLRLFAQAFCARARHGLSEKLQGTACDKRYQRRIYKRSNLVKNKRYLDCILVEPEEGCQRR